MRQPVTRALAAVGLYGAAHRLLQRVGRRYPHWVAMRFPPYDAAIHRRAIRGKDYVRYASLALALHRIEAEEIPGTIAELGVWRGHTSRFLHDVAPNRPLYLFDTFEGFPKELLDAPDARFDPNSLNLLQQVMGDLRGVTVRKGLFPDTAAGLEGERFALVVLDADLYQSTVAGLEFFYPRLSPGGYLFVHDYNSEESDRACFRALNEFMADKPERVVDLPDVWGSVLIRRVLAGRPG